MSFICEGEIPKNTKISEEAFFAERQKVVSEWPTGKLIDLDEAVEYQKKLPENKIYVNILREAKRTGRVGLSPRTGLGIVDRQINLMKALEGYVSGAAIHTDSFTRWHQFEKVEKIIEQMERTNKNLLNGYATVNYGVPKFRKIVESVNMPVRISSGTHDPRIINETGVAGGATASIVHMFPRAFAFPNDKVTLESYCTNSQYLYRHAGWYCDHGVELLVTITGANAATLMLPSLSLALMLVEVLAAVKQGAKHIEIGYYLMGALHQDVAALRMMPRMCRRYLDRFGYQDAEVFTYEGLWAGPFPEDPSAALGLLCHAAVTAALAGVNEIWMKTPAEVGTTPDIDDHLPSLRSTRQVLDMIGPYRLPDEVLAQECSMIEKEVDCLFNNILELGEGDVVVGTYRAYQNGSMEWPYSHTKYTAGKVMLARDTFGAIRVLDPGNLPFSNEMLEYHREKLNEKKTKKEKEKGVRLSDFDLVLDSIYTLGAEARCIESFESGLDGKKKDAVLLETIPYKGKITVILGVLNDIHHIGIDIMQKYLEKQSVKAISVGTMADQDDFIGLAREAAADAIFISTSNGMGEVDCDGLRDKCIEAGLKEIVIYVGGHLSVNIRKESWEEIEKRYKSLGINRAYAPHVPLDTVFRDLLSDLGRNIEP